MGLIKTAFQSRTASRLARIYLRLRFRYSVKGQAYLQQALAYNKGVLLAGNHTGLLDTILLTGSYPEPLTFLMRQEVTDWRFVGHLVRQANTIVLWRDRMTAQLRQSIEALQQGQSLVIFPEGELTKTGDIGPFNEGVGMLWHKGQAVLLPFVIHGGFAAWKEGQWHATGGVSLCLEYLPPLIAENDQQAKEWRKQLPEQLRQQIQNALNLSSKSAVKA